ncbi:MAG: ABC transporter ATP-binding protein [Lachnospiraceae bacterium]|nr:ABC transporter ATP-binding protein [uncultured Acetatifactor sp.]MCI8789366.1 ABC transporter ATP-binding protein [Lachnospiraceae bacterium]
MKKRKTPKNRPYRSTLDNALWSFREILKQAPVCFLLMALEVPLNVCLSFTEVYLPALVVAEFTGGAPLSRMAFRVGMVILLMLTANVLRTFSKGLSQTYYLTKYRFQKNMEVNRKSMTCFFQNYESKDIRELGDRATLATQQWNGVQPVSDVPSRSMKLVENILCYLLFGSVISFVSPLLVPILTIAPAVNWFCARAYRNWEYAHRDKWTDIDHRLWYVQGETADFRAGKDIRIYGCAGWFRQIYSDLCARRAFWNRQLIWRSFLSRIADLFVILLRDGAAYALLIKMTLAGELTVDRFLLYFSAISMFASFIGNIMTEWNGIRATSLDLCDYRKYLDLPEQDGTGEADVTKLLGTAPEITFEHVSFRYEGAHSDTLQDLNLTLNSGEKVALVGLNGAGKTTLVKLLCGLYLPTEGDIKINGISVRKFRRKDYYRLFAPVFQDVQTGFFSLAETVSGQIGEGTDFRRAGQCLELAGLGEKLRSLPQGIHTKLDKQLYADGIALSGGEAQKLMLARALYKDAPVLVLDEPTAALDPVAENQIYLRYQEMTQKKTSLFISHRLASTQFCDRILYLKDGQVAEEGTHQELIALGGEYAGLYEKQSCWYKCEKKF